MKKVLRIIAIVLASILALVAVVLVVGYINYKSYENKDIPSHVNNDTGLIQAVGYALYDRNGDEIILEGVNSGNLFVTEGWLAPYSAYGLENGEYPELCEDEFIKALYENPNLTDEQRVELLDVFYTTWFTEKDVKNIKDLGMNCLRVPFYYTNILNDDLSRKSEEEAFKYLDDIISWCAKYEVYVILDLHGCPGSQNGYEHSGYIDYDTTAKSIHFWYEEEYVDAVVDLWTYIAEHYAKSEDSWIIASYDIMNESRSKMLCTDKTCWDVYDKVYDAIRATGDKHTITLEGCWDFSALPDPAKYGWENVVYSYHWYNWMYTWLPNTLFYMYQDLRNIGRDYEVPVFIGEFTLFDRHDDWMKGLDLFEKRHYSWTIWTYKMAIYGWWENSWGLYNLNYGENYEYKEKVIVSSATYDEIKEAFLWTTTDNATQSSTYKTVEEFLNNK